MQGLEDGRFALISKTHHALVDGVAGVDIATVLFDLQPRPAEVEDDDWVAEPVPSDTDLVLEGVKGSSGPQWAGRASAGRPSSSGRTLGQVREAAEGLGEVVWAGLNPAPDVPLNVEIGPHRRVWWVRSRLSDFKEIKNTLGGTVNDAVLAVVAGALGRWLISRGVRTEGWSCGRSCRSPSAPRTSTEPWAAASPRCGGRFLSTCATRWSGCAPCSR